MATARQLTLTHDPSGAGVAPTSGREDAIACRLAEWGGHYHVDTPARAWLLRRLVVLSVRLDDCIAHQDRLRAYHAERAGSAAWDLDRRAETEEIAASLARRPSRAAAALARTRHGCDWLISRWRSLADASASGTPWDDAQRGLALDLLGTPPELRHPNRLLDPAQQACLADRELQRLERLRVGPLDRLDEIERSLVASGHHVCPDREMLRLQRYEASCLRAYYRTLNELMATPASIAPPEPEPGPDQPTPPDDQPDETPTPSRDREPLWNPRDSWATIDSDAPAPLEVAASPARPMNRRARRAALKLASGRR